MWGVNVQLSFLIFCNLHQLMMLKKKGVQNWSKWNYNLDSQDTVHFIPVKWLWGGQFSLMPPTLNNVTVSLHVPVSYIAFTGIKSVFSSTMVLTKSKGLFVTTLCKNIASYPWVEKVGKLAGSQEIWPVGGKFWNLERTSPFSYMEIQNCGKFAPSWEIKIFSRPDLTHKV